jgi:hypothetical protein
MAFAPGCSGSSGGGPSAHGMEVELPEPKFEPAMHQMVA